MVTCSPPMRPAIFVPLNTRDGVAQAPMEPGERCFLWLPWRGALALEVVALHAAGEALALAHGDGVDQLARLEEVGGELLADLVATRRRRSAAPPGVARVDAGLVEVALLRAWSAWSAAGTPQVTCRAA